MNNVAKDIMTRICELTDEKNHQLMQIGSKIDDARKEADECSRKMADATACCDLKEFQKAKTRRAELFDAIEMYDGRVKALTSKSFITEKESDLTIDRLLQYERDLDAEYRAAVAKIVGQLDDLTSEYRVNVEEAENTIRAWTETIHPNYRSFGRTLYKGGTDRSDKPIPVRVERYSGGSLADKTVSYIQTVKNEGIIL